MDDGEKLAAELAHWLVPRQLTICVAESLTAGHLQALIGSTRGSSRYFAGGLTAYNLRQKTAILQVDAAHATAVHGVSPRVAREMAAGARRLFATELAVATTGYAEPSLAEGVAVPFAHYAIDGPQGVMDGRIEGSGQSRTAMQRHVAREVLRELLDYLRAWDRPTDT